MLVWVLKTVHACFAYCCAVMCVCMYCVYVCMVSDGLCACNTGAIGEDTIVSVPDFEPGRYTFRVSAVDVFEQSASRDIPFSLTGK